MRLPPFTYNRPQDLNEALELLHTHGKDCKVLAGGTDLLVRMKQRLTTPTHLISLKALPELAMINVSDGILHIGSTVKLSSIVAYQPVQDRWPGLFEAVKSIGAPSIQHFSGTIGGNLCQDNRCQFYNQSKFFRQARQACNKAGGNTCFAWKGGSDKCHSVCQSDSAPLLIALDTMVVIKSKNESRTIPLGELYSSVGERPLTIADDEILTEIIVPGPVPGAGCAFEKLTYRSAIDYAVVSAGAFVQTDGNQMLKASLVIGAVARGPLTIATIEKTLEDRPVGDEQAIDEAAREATNAAEAFMANNMTQPVEYRTQMVSVITKRALKRATKRALSNKEVSEAK
ncbi:MAG: FAD binding domain-containing protein [Deltaproteobacteria bacterium]|nr:FAD binding domain-containing protein [Deltaproteobacteria bacterium]